MSKLTKFIILSILLTSSCGFKRNGFENYRGTINETINPNSSSLEEVQNISDVKDTRGCGMKISLGTWNKDKILNKRIDKGIWSRSSSAYDRGIIGSGEQYVDFRTRDFTSNLINNPKHHIVYIGPWQHAKRIGKDIRFVALQDIDYKNPSRLNYHGTIRTQFESKTPENQKIPSKSFSLLSDGRPTRSSICTVKWIANHGYNAISKVKSKNPFSKNYMIPSGEIIQAEE